MKTISPKIVAAALLLACAVGAFIYSVNLTNQNRPFALIPQDKQPPAPDFALKTADGKVVKLSDALRRGPVVLDFWATWCGPCHEEMPSFQDLYNEYKSKGVQFYGVNSSDTSEAVMQYAQQNNLTFPMLVDPQPHKVAIAYQVGAIPLILIIGKDRKVATGYDGLDPDAESDISRTLDQLLRS